MPGPLPGRLVGRATMANAPGRPQHPRLQRHEHEHTRRWSATVSRADAFCFVVPEHNFGFNAVIKNALDFLHHEWHYEPVGFVSYGGVSGGTRAVQMLKQVLTTVKLVPLAEAVSLPFVAELLGPDDHVRPNDTMCAATAAMLDELARVTEALAPLRQAAG